MGLFAIGLVIMIVLAKSKLAIGELDTVEGWSDVLILRHDHHPYEVQYMEGKMKRWFILVLMILAMLLGLLVGGVQANASSPFLAEYPVPGKPHMVSVEAPNRVWFTLPEENLIGRLVVTSTVEYDVDTYTVPTGASYPSDLKYAGGYVWFTQRDGNKIGRLDPATGAIIEYDIPTPDSEPTGIDVLIGVPTVVWFTEKNCEPVRTACHHQYDNIRDA